MKTYSAKPADIDKKWILIDAEGVVLGRLASIVAMRLRGKHKPTYSTFMDNGDFVVVINAEKIKLTGNKLKDKIYYRHSGYMGGLTETSAGEMLVKKPTEVLMAAVKGMLPKNSLGRTQLKKLKVYAGDQHPHEAQQPAELDL